MNKLLKKGLSVALSAVIALSMTGFAYAYKGYGDPMFSCGCIAEQSFGGSASSYCMSTSDYKAAFDAYLAEAAEQLSYAQAAYDKLNK